MPIYEFYCEDCHRVYNFLSRRVNTEGRPPCPVCGRRELARRVSLFAISKSRGEAAAGAEARAPDSPPEGMPDVDPARLESAMESLAAEAEGLDEDDPRQAARLMRRLYDSTGMPMNAGMQEALRRLEAGENPEKIEEEMGDLLEGDPFAGTPDSPSKGVSGLRRMLPPSVDPTLYEM